MTVELAWAEELPPNCPPADAFIPTDSAYFRLVESNPPHERDFWSHRKLYPEKAFYATECIARACTLLSSIERCRDLLKLPAHHKKKIVKIVLPGGSGVIKKTGSDAAHYSWWRAQGFDPVPACNSVSE